MLARQAQRLGEPAGTAGQVAVGGAVASLARQLDPLDDPAGAEQAPAGDALGPADDVRGPVHAVGEVEVEVPGRPEHHAVARRRPAERVGRRVAQPLVRLDLGHLDRHLPVPQHGAEQQRGDLLRRPREEVGVQHGESLRSRMRAMDAARILLVEDSEAIRRPRPDRAARPGLRGGVAARRARPRGRARHVRPRPRRAGRDAARPRRLRAAAAGAPRQPGRGGHADRAGHGRRPGGRARARAPTTTWSSRSPWRSWSRASTPSCGAPARRAASPRWPT